MMSNRYVLALLLLLTHALLQSPQCHAASDIITERGAALSPAEALALLQQRMREDSDGGLIINQMITVAGQDFYQHFVTYWRDKEGAERHTLTLRERASARWGSEVSIEYQQGQILRNRLPSSRTAIRQMAEEAAENGYQAVLQTDAQQHHPGDTDLARSEF
jgi:curli production assembly/transport component CsgE